MIKLNYLTTNEFAQKMTKNFYKSSILTLRILSVVIWVLGVIFLFFDMIYGVMITSISFGFFMSLSFLFNIQSQTAVAAIGKDLFQEELEMDQDSFTIKSIYISREVSNRVNLSSVEQIYWSNEGFVMKVGMNIFFVQTGTFESGSMSEIFDILKTYENIKMTIC